MTSEQEKNLAKLNVTEGILWGAVSGVLAGLSGSFLFVLAGAIQILSQGGWPTGLAAAAYPLCFGLLGGGIAGPIIGLVAVIHRADLNWPVIGAVTGTVMGPIPIAAISIGFFRQQASAWLILFAIAVVTGAVGGTVGGAFFKFRASSLRSG